MKNYLLGIDLGTTQVKGVLFDLEGRQVVKVEHGTYRILSRHANWAEQDADIWWKDTVYVIREIVRTLHGHSEEVAAVSISSQGMAMLPLDEAGRPLMPAHIWMDRRGVEETRILEEKLGRDYIKEHFGVYADPYYQAMNIFWFRRHCPEEYKKTRHIVKANIYLNYKLTGKYGMDETQAIMSMCYDIRKKQWSQELSAAMDVPLAELLPTVSGAEQVLGEVTREAAKETGLAKGTPVMVGSVDSAMALLEVGMSHVGDAAEITGTSSNTFFASQNMPPKESPILWMKPVIETKEVPNLMFAPVNATGEALRWTRNILGMGGSEVDRKPVYDHISQLVQKSRCGSRGLFFYPYLLGERAPLWNNNLRGMFIGATIATEQGDFLRAVYEGTSYVQRELCDEARKTGTPIQTFRITGGCARSEEWLKIKASILNMPVEVVEDNGGAPKGNAIVAGYGLGIYKDFAGAVQQAYHCKKVVEPETEAAAMYEELYPVFIKMRNHLTKDLDELAEVTNKYDMDIE